MSDKTIEEKLEAARKLTEGKKIEKVEISANHVDLDKPEQRQLVKELIQRKDMQQAFSPEKIQDIAEENEDLKNKLAIIAEKQFEKKRKEVGAPDSVNTPEKLQGFIEAKKSMEPKNEHGGVAPLNSFQCNGGQQQTTDLAHRKFANINEAIATLQAERRSGNNEAADLLDKLWQKSIHDWKAAGHPAQMFSIDDNMEKTSGTPDVNFDNYKAQEDLSEISRFGVKKSPHNYSKTHNAAGQKKSD